MMIVLLSMSVCMMLVRCQLITTDLEACLAGAAFGSWTFNHFRSSIYTSIRYHRFYSGFYSTVSKKARVLIIGDSINRDGVKNLCLSSGSPLKNYLNCSDQYLHGNYYCENKNFEIATFFIYGSLIEEADENAVAFNQKSHQCDKIPFYNSRDRIKYYLTKVNDYFTSEPTVILLNAELWTIVNYSEDYFYQENRNLLPFAFEYMRNMTVLISEIKLLYPNAVIFIQKNYVPQRDNFRINHKSVAYLNSLIDMIAANHGICTADLNNMASFYPGRTRMSRSSSRHRLFNITEADGFHPNLVIRTGVINLMLNIAYNMKVHTH